MADTLTAAQIHATEGLDDWRFVLGRIEARFGLASFGAGAALVSEIARLSDAAEHHPDVDLRYPGVVQVALVTHAAAGLTRLDVELARAISAAAASAGATVDSDQIRRVEVCVDALDIGAVLPFWRAVLGYVDDPATPEGRDPDAVVDPKHIGPTFWFQQMDEPRPQRNRIHVDVTVAHDVAEERLAAALAAGGRLVSDDRARAFWVLADAEGNEACLCTWLDRA